MMPALFDEEKKDIPVSLICRNDSRPLYYYDGCRPLTIYKFIHPAGMMSEFVCEIMLPITCDP